MPESIKIWQKLRFIAYASSKEEIRVLPVGLTDSGAHGNRHESVGELFQGSIQNRIGGFDAFVVGVILVGQNHYAGLLGRDIRHISAEAAG